MTALLVCSAEMECGKCWEVPYRACFWSQLCSKGPFVQTLSCSAGGCLLHDAKGNRDFFVVRGRLPCRQKLNPNQQFPSLSLPKSGCHSACVLCTQWCCACWVVWVCHPGGKRETCHFFLITLSKVKKCDFRGDVC